MSSDERRRRLLLLCVTASRALPDLRPLERVAIYEAIALVLPEKTHAQQAAFTAFALAKAEAAQLAMAGILRLD